MILISNDSANQYSVSWLKLELRKLGLKRKGIGGNKDKMTARQIIMVKCTCKLLPYKTAS